MFTGFIQAVGRVSEKDDVHLAVQYPANAWDAPFTMGESVAINGTCLTVVHIGTVSLRFQLSPETWDRTALGDLQRGDQVNLERAMRPVDRFGGHIVQGHVDGVGTIESIREEGSFHVLTVLSPADGQRYLIDKGSIAVDGISLTVVRPSAGRFDVWLVPHTMTATHLSSKRSGDRVNLEYDVIAKHVEQLLAFRSA